MAPKWLSTLTGIVIVGAWLASLVVGSFERDWTPLTITTPVMMLFGGYLFGIQVIRRGNGRPV